MARKPRNNTANRTVALCYVRRSWVKDAKDMVSPEIQRRNIERICEAHEWTPEWYEDAEGHKSGMYEKNRPGWLALKARLADGDVAALVANDLSRLHRKGWRIGDLLDFVDQHGIKLLLADPTKHIDFSTPHGRMIAQLSAIFDEWYVMDVSIRRKANIAYRKSQNKTVGLPPFGTKRDEEGYLIPSEEGAWLLDDGTWKAGSSKEGDPPATGAIWRGYFDCANQILTRFAEGHNRSKICADLTSQGYAFRGRTGLPSPLEADDIRRVTYNWVEYGGIVMDQHAKSRRYEELNFDEIVLDPERAVFVLDLLYEVGRQIVARSTRQLGKGRRKAAKTYPLSSMIYCAHCEELAQNQTNSSLRSRLVSRSRGRFYVHRSGIQCGRKTGQTARSKVEADFLGLIGLLHVDENLYGTMLKLAGKAGDLSQDNSDLDATRTAAIAKCQRKLDAARHLYEDGELAREEYLRRKEENEHEIAHWRAFTTEFQQVTLNLLLCVNAVGRLGQLWAGSSDEEKNRLARTVFEYVTFDLDKQKIVDFKLNPMFEHFLVLRAEAEVHDQKQEDEKCLKCDPGRIRTYDTPLKRRVLCH